MYKVDIARTRSRRLAAPSAGEWWRFSCYEIDAGWIRPARAAQLEWYDPWADFHQTRNDVGQAPDALQPAYASLMQLVNKLEFVPGASRYPDKVSPGSQNLIVQWSQQHGPLGILLSRWEALTLAPQLDPALEWIQRRYSRGFGNVIEEQQSSGDVEDRKASVLIHGLNDLALSEEPPDETWGRFFPSVPPAKKNSFPYPRPYTQEFCLLYRERLSDFCKAAKLLVRAMVHLGPTPPAIEGDPDVAREQALDTINILRRPVSSVLTYNKGETPLLHWVAPSLLASFAEMFVQDQLLGRPTLRCACCGLPFVSSAYQALYCSLKCRYVGQKRRLRQQMRQAIAFHAQGQTLNQISAALDQHKEVVRSWLEKHRLSGHKRGVRGRLGAS